MEIRRLEKKDVQTFCDLIKNMYENIENLEWFTPMPFDEENVLGMIEHPRFYIVGIFDNEKLLAVSSLDYKCGKLIGKIDFPANFDQAKMVEIGFNIVHYDYRGNGAMKKLVGLLLSKIKDDGFTCVFSKVHKDNIASRKSLLNNRFEVFCDYEKPVDKTEFKALADAEFFSKQAKPKAYETLKKFENEEKIVVSYNILTKLV